MGEIFRLYLKIDLSTSVCNPHRRHLDSCVGLLSVFNWDWLLIGWVVRYQSCIVTYSSQVKMGLADSDLVNILMSQIDWHPVANVLKKAYPYKNCWFFQSLKWSGIKSRGKHCCRNLTYWGLIWPFKKAIKAQNLLLKHKYQLFAQNLQRGTEKRGGEGWVMCKDRQPSFLMEWMPLIIIISMILLRMIMKQVWSWWGW